MQMKTPGVGAIVVLGIPIRSKVAALYHQPRDSLFETPPVDLSRCALSLLAGSK